MEKMDLESKYEPMPSPASGRIQTIAALAARVSTDRDTTGILSSD